jgi:hypothetical protein
MRLEGGILVDGVVNEREKRRGCKREGEQEEGKL